LASPIHEILKFDRVFVTKPHAVRSAEACHLERVRGLGD